MKKHAVYVFLALLLAGGTAGAQQLLDSAEVEKLLPKTHYEEGDNLPVQARNAAAVRLPGGKRVLAALVDTTGYSSQVRARYQGMLILEQAVELATRIVPAGIYGWGIQGDSLTVYDAGGGTAAGTRALKDPEIAPVKPLQVVLRHGAICVYAGKQYFVLWPVAAARR